MELTELQESYHVVNYLYIVILVPYLGCLKPSEAFSGQQRDEFDLCQQDLEGMFAVVFTA